MKTVKDYWNEDSNDYFKEHEVNINNIWFYKNEEAAKADDYRMFDWQYNPWAVLPQWIGFTARKDESSGIH